MHRDEEVRIDGLSFSGIARLELLQILQRRCRERMACSCTTASV